MKKVENRWSKNQLKYWPENNDDLLFALYESYKMAKRAKLRTDDENKFEMFFMENLIQLRDDIINRRYHPSRGKAFITHNPVIREIFAAPFRDRVVHHLLYAMNGLWWDKHYIYDSYSCRDGKGTLLGVQRIQHFMEKASKAGSKKAYIIKADISGYFMSLNRDRLFKEVLWGLERQFPNKGFEYELCRYLWAEIIFDDPVAGVRMAGSKKEWDPLPNNKSLFHQPPGVGIVIGNLTSQSLSNTYLNQLDRYMKYELKFKYYGRYVDDFVVVVPEEELEDAVKKFKHDIPKFLKSLGLKMHPRKFYVQPIERGLPFLGRVVHRTYLTAGKRTRARYWSAAQQYMNGLKDDESIISYLGMTKHLNAEKLNKQIFDSVGWDYNF
ncbi:MAG: RNA-directed DNA polymerase [Candidatus Saccharibacteria bacterium]|nr:RNA-directed DNA polymerase [Candidatus Saccharibacteria bacterium]